MPRSRVLDRYVLTGERVVVATRHHWSMLLEPVATTTAGFLVIGWLVAQAGPSVGDGVLLLWWLWLILVARLAWKVLEWRNEWFVSTDKRLLLLYGLITHKVAMMPLTKVTDLNYGRSIMGRILGYGQFVLESAGQDQALRQIDWVGHPEMTYRRICDTLFGPGGSAGRPGGGPSTAAPPAVVPPAPGRAASEPTQPLPVGRRDGDEADEEPGWAVSGEHRATYVPVVHPRPSATPVPKPYE